jgi:hypothetical protein
MLLDGRVLGDGIDRTAGERFISRTAVRLPVGWNCIEVFPFLDIKQWKPEYASVWAENDLLASVVARQLHEDEFRSLDPSADVRRSYARLLNEYRTLLDTNPRREEILQQFLREHPELLCPTRTRMWPKLALGEKITDFVFQEGPRNYLLVELVLHR